LLPRFLPGFNLALAVLNLPLAGLNLVLPIPDGVELYGLGCRLGPHLPLDFPEITKEGNYLFTLLASRIEIPHDAHDGADAKQESENYPCPRDDGMFREHFYTR